MQAAPISATAAAPSIPAQFFISSVKNTSTAATPSSSLGRPCTRASIPARSGSRITF